MTPNVVTIGGGHGQASLLGALVRLGCSITAVVGVTDDGGCSGQLRTEMGMAPPGDIRRCLIALSTRPALAARFDARLPADVGSAARSAGNLVLAEKGKELGSLQEAIDWAGTLLGCVGRVVPAAETAGVLHAYDLERGAMVGESRIERESASTILVNVEGPEHANPAAQRALAEADLVFMGPGSFIGSTLATLSTSDLAVAVVRSCARRILVQNLAPEAGARCGIDQHERIVRDHLVIKSGGEAVTLDVLSHSDDDVPRVAPRSNGSTELFSRLRHAGEMVHDELLLAAALAAHFGLQFATPRQATQEPEANRLFDETLASARRRLERARS